MTTLIKTRRFNILIEDVVNLGPEWDTPPGEIGPITEGVFESDAPHARGL